MGHPFALMFLNVKFEALTYAAHETDYSVRASAPGISGRSTSPQGELSAAPISEAFLKLWMWMSLQVMGCLGKCGLQKAIPDSTPQHIFVVPSNNPDAPQGAVCVNRSILRKLRRLERLRPESFYEKGVPNPAWVKALSPNQFLDYMIRVHKWCRVKVHRLGGGTWNKLRRATAKLGLQMDLVSVPLATKCQALLSPD